MVFAEGVEPTPDALEGRCPFLLCDANVMVQVVGIAPTVFRFVADCVLCCATPA